MLPPETDADDATRPPCARERRGQRERAGAFGDDTHTLGDEAYRGSRVVEGNGERPRQERLGPLPHRREERPSHRLRRRTTLSFPSRPPRRPRTTRREPRRRRLHGDTRASGDTPRARSRSRWRARRRPRERSRSRSSSSCSASSSPIDPLPAITARRAPGGRRSRRPRTRPSPSSPTSVSNGTRDRCGRRAARSASSFVAARDPEPRPSRGRPARGRPSTTPWAMFPALVVQTPSATRPRRPGASR